jgi:hypothetical protein
LLEAVGIRVPVRNSRDFPLFIAVFSHKICLYARCASAANTICKDIDIFKKQVVTLNQILKLSFVLMVAFYWFLCIEL